MDCHVPVKPDFLLQKQLAVQKVFNGLVAARLAFADNSQTSEQIPDRGFWFELTPSTARKSGIQLFSSFNS